MLPGLFITGTDTGVGKTWFTCTLLKLLRQKNIPIAVNKPIESGCLIQNNVCFPQDAEQLRLASQTTQSIQDICPYPLKAALAPDRAASMEGKQISIQDLVNVCQKNPQHFLRVIEGAGGFYSPLTHDGLNADLAKQLQLPIILVASDRLGCINHILLSYTAIKKLQLPILSIILNQTDKTPQNPHSPRKSAKLGVTTPRGARPPPPLGPFFACFPCFRDVPGTPETRGNPVFLEIARRIC